MAFKYSYAALILLLLHIKAGSYPQGAPTDTCDTISPARSLSLPLQMNDAPYVLLQTSVSYKPGQVINETIRHINLEQETWKMCHALAGILALDLPTASHTCFPVATLSEYTATDNSFDLRGFLGTSNRQNDRKADWSVLRR
ncbi:uncharacterized protein LOC118190089 isoform X2 [Stegodyphus dumicola]|uniref:uncharacterized protein LOC118190089 isoform X2 n=1 Tax=Stegodyphus dumicola TaxID=202533 RepID=UPI0015ADDA04|nr:uncharacterized protein LOC118190089 isoform X2 [Stegodyphus dumicola]